MFIFNLNVVFTTDLLKMAPIRVRFSPGFSPGAGFHREEFAPAWIETITQKMRHVGSADQANCTHRTYFLPVKLSSLHGARSTPEHSSP
jgi:hypothetical protein